MNSSNLLDSAACHTRGARAASGNGVACRPDSVAASGRGRRVSVSRPRLLLWPIRRRVEERNPPTRGLCRYRLTGRGNTVNWMGHWYKADKRYDLVLEMERILI